MRIVDLDGGHEEVFSICLEDWSDEARASGPKRREWIRRCGTLGMRAKLALGDDGTPGGQIQYLPIEHSFVDGEGLYMIHCIWIHGYEKGRGNFQRQGMGRALLEAAEQDARSRGAGGMAAWGMWLPFWMKASWFRKHGYRNADRKGLSMLVWKPFGRDARPPRWFRARRKPDLVPGKVTVTALVSGWCMALNLVYERAKRAAGEFGNRVVFQEIDTSDRATVADWGLSDAVLVDGRNVQKGPPPSYEKIRRIIEKRVNRLR